MKSKLPAEMWGVYRGWFLGTDDDSQFIFEKEKVMKELAKAVGKHPGRFIVLREQETLGGRRDQFVTHIYFDGTHDYVEGFTSGQHHSNLEEGLANFAERVMDEAYSISYAKGEKPNDNAFGHDGSEPSRPRPRHETLGVM